MYFSKVYLHVFYFLQRIFSYIFSLHTSYLDEEIYIDIDSVCVSFRTRIVVGSHVEIAICDNRDNHNPAS